MKKLLMVAALATMSLSSYAVNVSVTEQTCFGGSPNAAERAICDALTSELQAAVDADLPSVSLGKYGTGLANSNGFAQKGLTSDYSDKFTYFMVRGGVGAAVQGDIDKPESAEGFGFGAAATVGINLDLLPIDKIGFIEFDKMDLFVSFMNYDVDQDDDDFSAKGEFSHLGIMARYQVIEGKDIFPGYMLEWGGVFLHTGLQRSSFKADLTSRFDDQTVTTDNGDQATFGNTSATFALDTTTTTIPVEVSTYLRTIWALTFSAGAGFDYVAGSTDVDLSASGTASGASNQYSATVSASDNASEDADVTNFRAFGGVQLNLPFFRVYLNYNKGLGNDLVGANAGVKILW